MDGETRLESAPPDGARETAATTGAANSAPSHHRGHEPIAPSMDGLHVRRRLRVVSEGLPQEADRLRQRGVGDEGLLPYAVNDFLARHDLAGSLQQQMEDTQDTWRQRNFSAGTPQYERGRVELEFPELDGRGLAAFDGGRG